MNSKIVSLFLCLVLAFGALAAYGKDVDTREMSYELKCAGNGQQGYYLVEVTAYVDNKKKVNMDVLKKCAVHGVIFSGFSGEQGCKSQKAMLSPTREQQHADFFNAFFKTDYLRYASAVDPSMTTMKVGKRYAVTGTIQVAKDELRETLQDAGILKKLGF
ncbi:MAG: hypothetical protein NC102_08640 [Clostridium sp.]|nr:hypothetical protein [Clostridium sp.]